MEPKEIDIEFVRGDTCPVTFQLLDAEKQPLELQPGDEIYFTVKRGYSDIDFVFQKKYSTGEITQSDGNCMFTILPSDTANLDYGSYVYDACLVSGDYTRTFVRGSINLTNEATFASNQ
jgi:hypothetical protein